jgi:predicted transglutaminase-like cysteine proteinase
MFSGAYTWPRQAIAALGGVGLTLLACGAANAVDFGSQDSMKVLGSARMPIGYAMFCSTQPSECSGKGKRNARVALNGDLFTELDLVNRTVNERIAPVTDEQLYGVAERWSYPVDRGDCEDYVLMKRRILIDAGWDPSALLITVVRDLKGAGHAVLTVVTDRGDFVLDNQQEGVLPWRATGYQYVKRQSQTDPKSWVFVGPGNAEGGVASTNR